MPLLNLPFRYIMSLQMKNKKLKPISVALVGGLTAGPIMPLLALREEIKSRHPTAHFIAIDVAGSVASLLAKRQHVVFYPIAAGKLRRYFSIRTVSSPVLVVIGIIQSMRILLRHKVTQVIGAGGFVQVPVIWAAWLLRIPVHIHQQDISPTLANTLCAPLATTMSVTFESSLQDFPRSSGIFSHGREVNIAWTGNPVRPEILSGGKIEGQKQFGLDRSWPTVFIIGGGGGASGLNDLIYGSLDELTRTVQVIHSTGKGKLKMEAKERYHPYEFINRTELAYAVADIVVARAGIGTITELANLGKVSIIIPMPHTHQEANAEMLYQNKAAIVLDQSDITPARLVRTIRKILFDLELQHSIKENVEKIMPKRSAKHIIDLIGL